MVPHVTCVTLCPQQDLFLGIIRILVLFCYFQEKQRSFTSGDFWVLLRWQVTHFQFLSVFQDGGHVKFPTLGQRLKINVKIPTQGKARSVNFPWVPLPPPPPTLGLNIDRCIILHNQGAIVDQIRTTFVEISKIDVSFAVIDGKGTLTVEGVVARLY